MKKNKDREVEGEEMEELNAYLLFGGTVVRFSFGYLNELEKIYPSTLTAHLDLVSDFIPDNIPISMAPIPLPLPFSFPNKILLLGGEVCSVLPWDPQLGFKETNPIYVNPIPRAYNYDLYVLEPSSTHHGAIRRFVHGNDIIANKIAEFKGDMGNPIVIPFLKMNKIFVFATNCFQEGGEPQSPFPKFQVFDLTNLTWSPVDEPSSWYNHPLYGYDRPYFLDFLVFGPYFVLRTSGFCTGGSGTIVFDLEADRWLPDPATFYSVFTEKGAPVPEFCTRTAAELEDGRIIAFVPPGRLVVYCFQGGRELLNWHYLSGLQDNLLPVWDGMEIEWANVLGYISRLRDNLLLFTVYSTNCRQCEAAVRVVLFRMNKDKSATSLREYNCYHPDLYKLMEGTLHYVAPIVLPELSKKHPSKYQKLNSGIHMDGEANSRNV